MEMPTIPHSEMMRRRSTPQTVFQEDRWVYSRSGRSVTDRICDHGYESACCTAVCSEIGEHMVAWWNSLPGQSRVRVAKAGMMRSGKNSLVDRKDYEPDLERLSRQ